MCHLVTKLVTIIFPLQHIVRISSPDLATLQSSSHTRPDIDSQIHFFEMNYELDLKPKLFIFIPQDCKR